MKFLLVLICTFITFSALAQSLEEKINFLASEVEELKRKGSNSKLSFGGYGEIVYQNQRSELENGNEKNFGTTKNPTTDMKRFILYVGYEFTDKWRLISEIEVEHADEIYVEQAYIQYKINPQHYFRVGTLLAPVGIVNLFHEPTTFYSVDRPIVENKIIPTTWRENGMGLYGEFSLFEYHLYLMNSLDGSGFSSSGVRSGRQKAGQTYGKNFSWVGRLDHKPMENITIGLSAYIGGVNNTLADVGHNVFDIHFDGQFGAFHTRAMYVHSQIDKAKELSQELNENIGDKMSGYYLELGYDVLRGRSSWMLMPFTRYEQLQTQDDLDASLTKDKSTEQTYWTFGIAAKPMANLIFKADYVIGKNEAETGNDQWNLGVGWNF